MKFLKYLPWLIIVALVILVVKKHRDLKATQARSNATAFQPGKADFDAPAPGSGFVPDFVEPGME